MTALIAAHPPVSEAAGGDLHILVLERKEDPGDFAVVVDPLFGRVLLAERMEKCGLAVRIPFDPARASE